MNHFPLHIGDYAEATGHLTFIEDSAYLRCIRKYYSTEKPLPADIKAVQRLVGARSKEELQAVETVLNEFFTLEEDGWHNARCDAELAIYFEKSEKAKASANSRWKSSSSNANAMRTHTERNANDYANAYRTQCEGNANQEPRANNQEPILKAGVAKAPKAQRLKLESIPEEWFKFCLCERPDLNPKDVWEQFKDYWAGVSGSKGTKLDWPATWRNWVRNQKTIQKTTYDRKMQTLACLTGGIHGSNSDAQFKPLEEPQTIDMEASNASLLRQ